MGKSDRLILENLYQNREGLRVKTLMKLTSLKQRTLYKRLNILRDKNLLENIFPIWKLVHGQVGFCSTLIKSSNIFDLHNLSYIVRLIRTPDWWDKRKNYLVRLKGFQFKNVNFGQGGSNPYQQLINDNFVIQCYPESIIIISKKRYYANNPYETIIEAMTDIRDLLEWFCERFRFNFFADGIPHIEIRNNDYNRLKDHLAEYCKKKGTKFLVELDKKRKVWIDRSEPFGKEANYPTGQVKLEKVTKDILLNDPLLPSEAGKIMKENQKDIANLRGVFPAMEEYNKNLKLHTKVQEAQLDTQSKTLETQKETLKVLGLMEKKLK